MNSTAFKIKKSSNNTTDAIRLAEHDLNLKETIQDWEREITEFVFEDGSRLVINNDEIKAFRQ